MESPSLLFGAVSAKVVQCFTKQCSVTQITNIDKDKQYRIYLHLCKIPY